MAGLHVLTSLYTDPEYPLGGYFSGRLDRNAYNNPRTDELWLAKVPSTPQDQSLGVLDGIRAIAGIAGVAPGDLATILRFGPLPVRLTPG